MEKAYERYGLVSNPFRDVSSEGTADLDVMHVAQSIDEELRILKEEVLEKSNKAVVAVTGRMGAGKTHRLRVIEQEMARRPDTVTVFQTLSATADETLMNLAETLLESLEPTSLQKYLSPPKWYRRLAKLAKPQKKAVDFRDAGDSIAKGMNAKAPVFLLLNDLHNMTNEAELDLFLTLLHGIADGFGNGVLVMLTSTPEAFERALLRNESLKQRVNKVYAVPPMTVEEATLLIAKRLMAKRLDVDIDPLFPFDGDAVALLATDAKNNPRQILKDSSHALDYAVKSRAIRIDAQLIRIAFERGENRQLTEFSSGVADQPKVTTDVSQSASAVQQMPAVAVDTVPNTSSDQSGAVQDTLPKAHTQIDIAAIPPLPVHRDLQTDVDAANDAPPFSQPDNGMHEPPRIRPPGPVRNEPVQNYSLTTPTESPVQQPVPPVQQPHEDAQPGKSPEAPEPVPTDAPAGMTDFERERRDRIEQLLAEARGGATAEGSAFPHEALEVPRRDTTFRAPKRRNPD